MIYLYLLVFILVSTVIVYLGIKDKKLIKRLTDALQQSTDQYKKLLEERDKLAQMFKDCKDANHRLSTAKIHLESNIKRCNDVIQQKDLDIETLQDLSTDRLSEINFLNDQILEYREMQGKAIKIVEKMKKQIKRLRGKK